MIKRLTGLVIIFLIIAISKLDAQESKGKLFIIGGGKRSNELMQRMINESGVNKHGGYVYILPMASENGDTALILATKQFQQLAVNNVQGHNFAAKDQISAEIIDSVRNAQLIYIPGGDQNRFMLIAKALGLDLAITEAYHKGAMIAGTSAGAAVMSQKMITGNQAKIKDEKLGFPIIESQNIEIGQGLGLLKTVIIDQHFIIRQRLNRLISVALENPDQLCIGIDESTAILISGKKAEVIGESQVIVIHRGAKKRIATSGKMGANGLKISIYLPRESFSLYR